MLQQQPEAAASASRDLARGRPRGAEAEAARPNAVKRDLLQVQQLIDLTEEPICLTRADIGWSRVRASASNCICCCVNNSIALVTTSDAYTLDHIPLDNIQAAQASASLAHLAMSNGRQIAIIELVESNLRAAPNSSRAPADGCSSNAANGASKRGGAAVKLVNLAGSGLSMGEVLLWRWLDDSTLAILSREALFVCNVEQTRLNHPTASALARAPQLLALERVCDLHPNLSGLCQIANVQRDESRQLYAISGLYSPSAYLSWQASAPAGPLKTGPPSHHHRRSASSSLKHSFSSVPGRLSQLAGNSGDSFESLPPASDKCTSDLNHNNLSSSAGRPELGEEICGIVQVHCRMRDCSQLIQAQAAAFVSCPKAGGAGSSSSTTLIAANRTDDKLRVHFVGMASSSDLATSGQSASPSTRFSNLHAGARFDLPTSIVCSRLDEGQADSEGLHVALVTTKYGQLFVCSVQYGTILFNVRITHDVISSTVLESKSGGLMVICRNGQVLLVQLNTHKLARLLEASRSLRPVPSYELLDCGRAIATGNCALGAPDASQPAPLAMGSALADKALDLGLDVLESTKL